MKFSLGAILLALGVSAFAAENTPPAGSEYKTTADNDYIWVPEANNTPIIPNGTSNTRICKFKSSRGLCYQLELNDSTAGGIPIPFDTQDNFQTLLDLLDREPNKSYCEISPEIWSPYAPQGSIPTACGDHTYTEVSTCSQLPNTCPGACSSATRDRQVTINNGPCGPPPTVSLRASPTEITVGSSTRLDWSSANADRCEGNFAGANTTLGARRFSFSWQGTFTYRYTCYNANGSNTATAAIRIVSGPPPTVTVSASPNSVTQNEQFVASWDSQNADRCTSSDIPGVSSDSGSSYMSLGSTGSHTLRVTCTGPGGSSTGSTTVSVGNATPAPTVTVTAPGTVIENTSFDASWSSTNATVCASAIIPGVSATSGTRSMRLSPGGQRYTLRVTCEGPGGYGAGETDVIVATSGGGNNNNNDLVWKRLDTPRCQVSNWPVDWNGIHTLMNTPCDREGEITGRASAEYCFIHAGQPDTRHVLRYRCERR